MIPEDSMPESPEPITGSRPAHPPTTTKPQGEVRHGHGTRAETASSRGDTLEDVLASENVALAWTAPAAIAASPECEATPQIVPQGG
jgi:hypothetical protein